MYSNFYKLTYRKCMKNHQSANLHGCLDVSNQGLDCGSFTYFSFISYNVDNYISCSEYTFDKFQILYYVSLRISKLKRNCTKQIISKRICLLYILLYERITIM